MTRKHLNAILVGLLIFVLLYGKDAPLRFAAREFIWLPVIGVYFVLRLIKRAFNGNDVNETDDSHNLMSCSEFITFILFVVCFLIMMYINNR